MANLKISQLSNASALGGSEPLPIVQSSSTVKTTTQDVANLALPDQTGQAGNYLTTNGTVASWGAVSAGSTIYTSRFSISSGVLSETNVNNNTGVTLGMVIGPLSGEQLSVSFLSTPPNLQIAWIFPTVVHNSVTYFPRFQSMNFIRVSFQYYDSANNPANFTANSTPAGQSFYITGIFNP